MGGWVTTERLPTHNPRLRASANSATMLLCRRGPSQGKSQLLEPSGRPNGHHHWTNPLSQSIGLSHCSVYQAPPTRRWGFAEPICEGVVFEKTCSSSWPLACVSLSFTRTTLLLVATTAQHLSHCWIASPCCQYRRQLFTVLQHASPTYYCGKCLTLSSINSSSMRNSIIVTFLQYSSFAAFYIIAGSF